MTQNKMLYTRCYGGRTAGVGARGTLVISEYLSKYFCLVARPAFKASIPRTFGGSCPERTSCFPRHLLVSHHGSPRPGGIGVICFLHDNGDNCALARISVEPSGMSRTAHKEGWMRFSFNHDTFFNRLYPVIDRANYLRHLANVPNPSSQGPRRIGTRTLAQRHVVHARVCKALE
jgi:hypothetical protein